MGGWNKEYRNNGRQEWRRGRSEGKTVKKKKKNAIGEEENKGRGDEAEVSCASLYGQVEGLISDG